MAVTYTDLLERVEKLESHKLALADLPLSHLQDKLERDWQPNGGVLLGLGSVTADRLDAVYKVGLPYGAGWADYGAGTGEVATVSRIGRLVQLQGLVTKTGGAPAANDVIGTLPAGCRPTGSLRFAVVTGATTSFGCIRVETTGNVVWVAGSAVETDFTDLSTISFVI